MLSGSYLKRDSLSFRSRLSLMVTAVALLLTLTLTNLYSFQLLTQNMRDSMVSGSQLFASDLQASLDESETGAWELVSPAADAGRRPASGKLDAYLTGMDILEELDQRVTYVQAADLFYFYRPDQAQLLMRLNPRVSTGIAYLWESFLRQDPDLPARVWNTVVLNEERWLTLHFDVQGIQVGTAVRLTQLFARMRENKGLLEDISYTFIDSAGQVIYSSDDLLLPLGDVLSIDEIESVTSIDGRLYMTEFTCLNDNSALIFYRPLSHAIFLTNSAFWWIVLLSVVALLIITLLLRNTNRHITHPIDQLSEAVHQVEQGNWDYRLEQQPPIRDFQRLFGGFNHMVQEIHHLKISAYESELERHRNELRYLQLQIRPHFYLNAITTISSLTYQGRLEDVRTFIDALSHYLRYLFSGEDTQVTVEDEISHCQSYVQLQQIKYPDKIFFMPQIAEEARTRRIPKFLIQTAVENIFKHGFSPENFLSVFVEICETSCKRNDMAVRGLQITVEDNGCGFPETYIASFPQPATTEHVGLSNLWHTLRLIYGEDADLHVANAESGGAYVTFFLPLGGEEDASADS